MKATFGLVSLLIALAIIGIVINKQLKAVGKVPVVAADGRVSQGSAASGSVREQSQQLQEKARSDVVKALEQGAAQGAARQDDAGK
jgi:hypothetical protein